ncbi:hypothetical protein ANCCEY_02373 [Ancylostoma ceylanicum]|uniref:Uncharacterized protein n=1 Tax=Ancylostoma ceylanicum TaxID=53326 RepID=A0A0D6MC97_9BILA|nr:hypothetical protein ANCCEY_02373 [Ancylostoma ceylanicum]
MDFSTSIPLSSLNSRFSAVTVARFLGLWSTIRLTLSPLPSKSTTKTVLLRTERTLILLLSSPLITTTLVLRGSRSFPQRQ